MKDDILINKWMNELINYLRVGLSSNIPLRQRQTKICPPNFTLFAKILIEDSAERTMSLHYTQIQ